MLSSETMPDSGRSYAGWVASLRNMDDDAWNELLHYYGDDLRRDIEISLHKRRLPLELADDIEQETWLTAIRKFAQFVWEDEEKFYHWLRAISFNHVRKIDRLQRRGVSIEDHADGDDSDDGMERFFDRQGLVSVGVEEDVLLRERLSALDLAMRELQPLEREILMRRIMGETPRTIAQSYQMKARSVSMVVLRAKQKIEFNLVHLQSIRLKDKRDD